VYIEIALFAKKLFKKEFFMSGIRELSFEEIALVSGGEGHGTEVNRDRQDARNAAQRGGSGGAPVTTANKVGFVIIGGVLTAVASGLGGPVAGAVVGTAFSAAAEALPEAQSGSGGNNGSWHDTNPGAINGECRW